MFEIEIKNLKTKAYIGITAQERKKSQPLLVTLRFQYSISTNYQLDNIKYLKDYSAITKTLKSFILNSKCKSLEKLLVECSSELKKKFELKKVFLSINKISVARRYRCESLSVSQ